MPFGQSGPRTPGIARLNKHLIAKKKHLRRERTNRGRWKSTKRKYEAHEEKCIVFLRDGSTQFTVQIADIFFLFIFNASIYILSVSHLFYFYNFAKKQNVALAVLTMFISSTCVVLQVLIVAIWKKDCTSERYEPVCFGNAENDTEIDKGFTNIQLALAPFI